MEHFSAVKFAIGYEKNMSFLAISNSKNPKYQNPQKFEIKVKKLDWASLRVIVVGAYFIWGVLQHGPLVVL